MGLRLQCRLSVSPVRYDSAFSLPNSMLVWESSGTATLDDLPDENSLMFLRNIFLLHMPEARANWGFGLK